jgi:choline dehydrogenase-like flavoprotein
MRTSTTLGALVTLTAAGLASAQNSSTEYDYVIVGGGLTGLVAAARLTEDPDVSVLVLEYGIIDRSNVTQIPYYGTVLNTAGLRNITSAPEPHLNNKSFAVRASQLAGGGSQVNGMQWDLPSGADFDACEFDNASVPFNGILTDPIVVAELGNPGWDWKGLRPYYKKVRI